MGRLTERNQNGNAYHPFCFSEDGCDGRGSSTKCNGCNFAEKVIDKLAAYEDTIEDPEKLKLIDEWYSELCKENGQLKKELAELHNEAQAEKVFLDKRDNEIRNSTIDDITEEVLKQFTEFDLKHGYPTITDCKIILKDTAEKMKGNA